LRLMCGTELQGQQREAAHGVRNATAIVFRRAPHFPDSPVAAHQWSADKMAVEGRIRGIRSAAGSTGRL